MAAPVGHIFCALLLLDSGYAVQDKNAFLAGTSFPDIRYISSLSRAHTHELKSSNLFELLDIPSSFEAGRRFHVFVDIERERYMKEKDAYRFVQDAPYKTHWLKIIEDRIIRDQIKIDAKKIFGRIYDEERAFLPDEKRIADWHRILSTYLDDGHWFHFTRYLSTWNELQRISKKPDGFFNALWQKTKALGFFIYAYAKLEKLQKDPELRSVVFGFYKDKMTELINSKLVPD